MQIKGVTSTMIFESSALNRDEKIGGNILSIKKYSSADGVYSYIGRPAVRYSLFQTLQELFNWKEAPLKLSQSSDDNKKKVVQFDFPTANIVSYPEMDVFGYMITRTGDSSIIRKAPLGITKAVSLEPWMADMAFYANHDLINRLRRTGENCEPNPYQKEEHYSWYKLSFTIDLTRLGYHELMVGKMPEDLAAYIESLAPAEQTDLHLGEHEDLLPEIDQWYAIEDQGYLGVKAMSKAQRIVFVVKEEEKKRRLRQLLTVMKNGLMYHASTENYGMIPLFNIIGGLRVPAPLFHGALRMNRQQLEVEALNHALRNDYLAHFFVSGPLSNSLERLEQEKMLDWSGFLCSLTLAADAKE
jgi:CRISPR-associated protein Cst2